MNGNSIAKPDSKLGKLASHCPKKPASGRAGFENRARPGLKGFYPAKLVGYWPPKFAEIRHFGPATTPNGQLPAGKFGLFSVLP
jgi:hypothetical protein